MVKYGLFAVFFERTGCEVEENMIYWKKVKKDEGGAVSMWLRTMEQASSDD